MATGLHHGRPCSRMGCGRRMPPLPLNGMPGHRMCCVTCNTGTHIRQCDRAFRRFNRQIVSECRTAGCLLQVQVGHTTCCSTCWLSGGGQHTRGCSRRQGLLTARLHAMTMLTPPGTAAGSAAWHSSTAAGSANQSTSASSLVTQGQTMGGNGASSSGQQRSPKLIEVLSSGEEDQNGQERLMTSPTAVARAQPATTTCAPAGEGELDLSSMD